MLLYYLADIAMSFNTASLLSSAQIESTVSFRPLADADIGRELNETHGD